MSGEDAEYGLVGAAVSDVDDVLVRLARRACDALEVGRVDFDASSEEAWMLRNAPAGVWDKLMTVEMSRRGNPVPVLPLLDLPEWPAFGAVLLDQVIVHDDEMGHLANATADELREALRLAASRLRDRRTRTERDPLLRGARRLVAEVWELVRAQTISARSPAGDAALDLRDTIDTTWEPVAADERPSMGGKL